MLLGEETDAAGSGRAQRPRSRSEGLGRLHLTGLREWLISVYSLESPVMSQYEPAPEPDVSADQPPSQRPAPQEVLGQAGRRGPLRYGERIQVTDTKGRKNTFLLDPQGYFQSVRGSFHHRDVVGMDEGSVIETDTGHELLLLRPLLADYVLSMPRGAQVVYPKDSGQIVAMGDIFPGARVLEAGVGSGALSLALLRVIGPEGRLYSYERRQQFADVARRNVENFLSGEHPAWDLTVGDLAEVIADEPVDRAILDMLAPWECINTVGEQLIPGGVICCYVATTTQLGRVMDTFRAHGGFTEPTATETTVRDWHAEGLAIRPGHGTSAHTGFLVFSRRLAPGVSAPVRKRRPAPGAYGPDYQGPRPLNMPESR